MRVRPYNPPPPNRPLAIEYRSIHSLKFNPKNPNRHTRRQIKQLARSLAKLGMNRAVGVDADGVVLNGEALVRAHALLGWEMIPVVVLDHLKPAEALAYMIAENRFAQLSKFDEKALAELFKELSALNLDFSLEVTGFETGEIDLRIEGLNLDVLGSEEAEADLLPAEGAAVSKVGDVWVMHNPKSGRTHRLLCGDALFGPSYAALMADTKAHAIITDPPFGGTIASYLPGNGKTKYREFVIGSEGRTPEELRALLTPLCEHIRAHSRPGALAYIFMDWRGIHVLIDVGLATFAEMKNLIVWVKTQPGMGAFYRSQHELVALFKVIEGRHRNNVQLGAMGRNRSNAWSYPGMSSVNGRQTDEGDLTALGHPTIKPVDMIADAILDCTERGDIVLDPFLGSGTTLIAAERVGRSCYGLELDPLYVDVAVRRWQKLTGAAAIHEASGKTFGDLAAEVRS